MERFLLLWDELDEFVGLGRLFVASMAHSVTYRMRRYRRPVASAASISSEA
ncbi:MAG: hypothetical protein WDO12_10970 [Pseudomonadota bacterium]